MERHPALKDIQVLERGWLSSNNIIIADEDALTEAEITAMAMIATSVG